MPPMPLHASNPLLSFADRMAWVEGSAIRELFKLLNRPGMISFAGGFPDPALFDAEGIAQASAAALAQQPNTVLQYGPTEGCPMLREALSSHLTNDGIQVPPDGLIVTTGSQQALDLLGKTLVSPGDRVLVESPTFLAAIQCFRLYGANVIGAPVDAQGIEIEPLETLIRQHRPKLIYLVPTFGNPGGATLCHSRRMQLLDIARRTQTLLVEDDPYGQLYFDGPPPDSLLALSDQVPGSRPWVAHCGSLSKVLSPGLRVGWLIAPPELLSRVAVCKQFSDANTSALTQGIAAHYLMSNRLHARLKLIRQVYGERARTMHSALHDIFGDHLSFTPPQGGMFFWARFNEAHTSRRIDTQQLARLAIGAGVAFVPGAPFYAQDPDPQTLRLSFATVGLPDIVQGVHRLGQAYQQIQ